MDAGIRLDVPIEDLSCRQCRVGVVPAGLGHTANDNQYELPYSRVDVKVGDGKRSNPVTVSLDVNKLELRRLGRGVYEVMAVISLKCPRCGRGRELKYELKAPAVFLTNLGPCRLCGGDLVLEDEKLSYRDTRQGRAQIDIEGKLVCCICKNDASKNVKIDCPTLTTQKSEALEVDISTLSARFLEEANGRPQRVFLSYCHKDRIWLERFLTYLSPMARDGYDFWSDSRIRTGAKWEEALQVALDSAQAAVLIVSPHFLASTFITDVELPKLLAAAEKRGLKITWIAVSACSFECTQIAHFQAANDPRVPLDTLKPAERGRVFVEICQKVRTMVDGK
jgi:hypothetical protein